MDDFRPVVVATSILFVLCSTLSVSLRLCRSFYMLRKFSWHDFLILMALLCALIMSAGMALSTAAGLGLHDDDTGSISTNATFQKVILYFLIHCRFSNRPSYSPSSRSTCSTCCVTCSSSSACSSCTSSSLWSHIIVGSST